MKKIFSIIVFLFGFFVSFGQPIVNRAGQANTVADARLQATLNFFVPRFADTAAANVQKGIDSSGAMIFAYNTNSLWVRAISPKRWVEIGSGGGISLVNLGSGFRLYSPNDEGIKTLYNGLYFIFDSTSNVNGITGGVDTTAMFPVIRASIPSSIQSLNDVAHVGNSTDTILINAGNISYQTYGTVWADDFKRSTLGGNYVNNAPSSTVTFPSSAYMNLTGSAGATAWTNLIARTDSTNENKGAITTTIVINTKSATSYGFAIGWGNLNTLCCDHHVYGGITLTTGTNNLFFSAEAANLLFTDPVALTIANGDTIVLTLSQSDWEYKLSYYNYTTKVSRLISYTGNPAGGILPFTPNGFSRPVFVHLGGSLNVLNLSRVSNESKYAKNLFVGNSLTLGGNIVDASQRYPYLALGGNHAGVIINGAGGTVCVYQNATYDEDISRYVNVDNLWFMGGGNDTLFSVWSSTGKAAATALRNRWVASGRRFIWMTPMPRDATPMAPIRDWIVANFPTDPIVDFYTRFNVGGQLPAPFDAGDGTHLTNAANRAMAAYIDSLYPQFTLDNSIGTISGYNIHTQYVTFTGLQQWSYPLTSSTVYVKKDVRQVKINPPTAIPIFNISLPYDVEVGYECMITFGGDISAGIVVNSLAITSDATQIIVKSGFNRADGASLAFGTGDVIYCRYSSVGVWDVTAQRTYQFGDANINGHIIGRGNNQATQSNFVAGYFAGQTLSSGSSNTFVGNQAGQLTTTGMRNTVMGANAFTSNVTGTNNTAIGEESMGGGGSKTNSTALGYASLFNATGTDNVGVGVNSGFEYTTGTFNTAIGSNAGRGITTGGKNTIIGANTLGLPTTLSNNVIIADGDGNQVLRRIATGQIGFAGITTPTAWAHLPAGTATASTAPLKFTSGTNLTTPESGAMEYDGSKLYFTPNTITATRGNVDVVRYDTWTAGAFGIVPYIKYHYYTGTVTTTATMPTIANNSNVEIVIINQGTQNVDIVSSAGANDLWENGAASNLVTLLPGASAIFHNNGTYWSMIN